VLRCQSLFDGALAEAASKQFLKVSESSRGMNWIDFRSALPHEYAAGTAIASVVAGAEQQVLVPLMRGFTVCASPTQACANAGLPDKSAGFRALHEAVDEARVPHVGPIFSRSMLDALGMRSAP